MKFFLAFVVFIVAVIAAEVPLNVAYPVQEISSCTVGKKFVSAPRSRYVFQCIKPGDGKVVACRDYDGKEVALGGTFDVNGEKYHCYKNTQGVIESDKIQ